MHFNEERLFLKNKNNTYSVCNQIRLVGTGINPPNQGQQGEALEITHLNLHHPATR